MFARLNVYEHGKRCVLYAVTLANEQEEFEASSLFDKFLDENDGPGDEDEISALLEALALISERGALDHYLRDEDKAWAIPRIAGRPRPKFRVYVSKFGRNVLVLFGGGEKTSQTSQGGTTRSAFEQAQRLGRALDKLQSDGNLSVQGLEDGETYENLEFEY